MSLYDFYIVSTPRSGSHALASALDTHPDIQCHMYGPDCAGGLFGQVEKPIVGRMVKYSHSTKQLEFTEGVKCIVLTRNASDIARSLHLLNAGYVPHRNLAPKQYPEPPPGRYEDMTAIMELTQGELLSWAKQRPNSLTYIVDYADLFDGDTRKLEPVNLLAFLGVSPAILTPLTVKAVPMVIQKLGW